MRKKYKYLEDKSKETIDYANKENTCILMTVDGYITDLEALILRDFLWYAKDKGVDVIMVPSTKDKHEKNVQ